MARPKEDLSVVGKNWARLDGADKVTGRSIFADDVRLPGMLYRQGGAQPACPRAHSEHRHQQGGGLAGRKGRHHAGGCQGCLDRHEPAAAAGRCREIRRSRGRRDRRNQRTHRRKGRPKLVEIEYELLPSLTDPRDAIKEDAVQLHEKAKGNIAWEVNQDFGDPDRVFAECEVIHEDEYITNATHNCYAEYHVCVSDFSQAGKLVVYTPTQTAILFQKAIAGCIPDGRERRAPADAEYRRRLYRPDLGATTSLHLGVYCPARPGGRCACVRRATKSSSCVAPAAR